ncbi:MAG: DUF4931 domain-containing protein [Lactobacillales bacterium]|jgi:galactose-1-phosphate uridylyltransferase|nr:DUF4931 domain-containing protein [Lactobacillales bacterium]
MKPLIFSKQIAKDKPTDMQGGTKDCPFCDYQETYNILKTQGELIWTKNKYPTLEDTFQTLIIETKEHEKNISSYSYAHNREMLKFAVDCWQEMKASGKYRSVLLFKNHGALSGGSLKHAHMQIVGLDKLDGYEKVSWENMQGMPVAQKGMVEVNFSLHPVCGFVETNVLIPILKMNTEEFNSFADCIKEVVTYHLENNMKSFNLFFYELNEHIICKFVPRYPAPPYYIGYQMPQVLDKESLDVVCSELGRKIKANVVK